jgi:hypothetical protein
MKAVVDRIEEGIAVVLLGDKEVKLEVALAGLPSGTKEGTWLKVGFELDPEGEMNQRSKIGRLIEKLKNKEA